ncbi:hypothetical protein [uncultured Catenibacterium sp.]|uniref:hypothetical protein n=1 Tax=uncultured Catenibacterium sp. TaxID=286142 RepID=UPI002598E9C7|nr:hypothetical protein [uncultured Catenibacterium sp.]
MIYVRKNLEDVKFELGIYDDELITYCCECGKEIKLDHEDIKHLESFDSTSYLCADCTKKHKEPEEQKTTFKDLLEGGELSGIDPRGKAVCMIIGTDKLIHEHLSEKEATEVFKELNEALRVLYKDLKGA